MKGNQQDLEPTHVQGHSLLLLSFPSFPKVSRCCPCLMYARQVSLLQNYILSPRPPSECLTEGRLPLVSSVLSFILANRNSEAKSNKQLFSRNYISAILYLRWALMSFSETLTNTVSSLQRENAL